MGDILLNKNTLKRVCDKMRVNILERRSKEREKRKREREKEDKVKGINIPLSKLNKLSASDILKLIYNLKESKQAFSLS
jgi:hypothetical protein